MHEHERLKRVDRARRIVEGWQLDAPREHALVIGSTARGWFEQSSDIDVAVISPFKIRGDLEYRAASEISVTYLDRSTVDRILGIDTLDLVQLRILSNLACGIPVVGGEVIRNQAFERNQSAVLRQDIVSFYLEVAARYAKNLIEGDLVQRLKALNQSVQCCVLLACAATSFRVLKLKWAMYALQQEAPDVYRLCTRILNTVGRSPAYRDFCDEFTLSAADVANRSEDDRWPLSHLLLQLNAVRASTQLPTSTLAFLELTTLAGSLRSTNLGVARLAISWDELYVDVLALIDEAAGMHFA
ncbi:hypothetical protein HFN01_08590 [Rhizobium leguminosarum]|uniref:nucleotidyltransferase domain-containing protein n=1 Tax=Rhizobium leguminosarum TaxID=384 RepID=UPI001C963437|nr:nucleotidyltransferase domain-containing protein [Rhizobium leguminosarum]MBY5394886.1 hypothetical protein [Rhizobium leguminosarum]